MLGRSEFHAKDWTLYRHWEPQTIFKWDCTVITVIFYADSPVEQRDLLGPGGEGERRRSGAGN